MGKGVISIGVTAPIIRSGDNLQQIIIDSVLRTECLEDGDIIGITESIVARSQDNYVTVDEIAVETIRLFGDNPIIMILNPIYSRNRFSMILKGIARASKKVYIKMPEYDEVGNPRGINPWTGINIEEYYKNICKKEHCECVINPLFLNLLPKTQFLDCSLHPKNEYGNIKSLKDYFPDKCEYGLLGSNKANEEKLKLFPNTKLANELVNSIQKNIKETKGIDIQVMIYGDGMFKDGDSGIWEFADPVAAVAYTDGLKGSPNELKLKAFADDKFKDLSGKDLEQAIKNDIRNKDLEIKNNSLKGKMCSQGTTPRRYVNLLASLMDLTSGSGDKGTPIVLVKNYFKNYSYA